MSAFEPNPLVPDRFKDTCRYAVSWAFAGFCRASCFYCFAGGQNLQQPLARAWTDEDAMHTWGRLRSQNGPMWVGCSGIFEPTEELGVLVALSMAGHYGYIQTNLMAEPGELADAVDPGRFDLHPTFHPHVWRGEAPAFLHRLNRLRDEGFTIPFVAMVAHPVYFRWLEQWVDEFVDAGYATNVQPMRSMQWAGKDYPADYNDAERVVLRGLMPGGDPVYTDNIEPVPLRIASCSAGHNYCCISRSGDVMRCAQVPNTEPNNIFNDNAIDWDAEPLPCGEEFCRCNHLYALHTTEVDAGDHADAVDA